MNIIYCLHIDLTYHLGVPHLAQVAYNAAMTACERGSQWQAPNGSGTFDGIAAGVFFGGKNQQRNGDLVKCCSKKLYLDYDLLVRTNG